MKKKVVAKLAVVGMDSIICASRTGTNEQQYSSIMANLRPGVSALEKDASTSHTRI